VAGIGLDDLDHRVPVPGSGDELDRLAVTMNDMLARLESSSVAQRRFVADASHELRTPLTRLRVALEVELAAPTTHPVDVLRSALEDTIEMQGLVEDLLLLARHDATVDAPRHRPVDLDAVVDGELAAVRADAEVRLTAAMMDPCMVLGDASQLGRLVANLLSNAARYATNGVDVSLSSIGGEAVLVVDDDGPGIPAPERDRVLERFVRLEEARTSLGSGLGLAIVSSIAAQHGGTVSIDDSPTGGARLVVRLPALGGDSD
jgi:signal transduction histidine kinase